MSFFPVGFDPRSPLVGCLNLAEVNTTSGDFRFMIGQDGIYTDISGRPWYGSQLITMGSSDVAINGTAPSGEVTLSFFQDQYAPSLISEVRSIGLDYVKDRPITFYIMPFSSHEELFDPVIAPIQVMQRIMTGISFSVESVQDRSITLSFESPFEHRKSARRLAYNTEDHARLIGEANPSLEFMPQENDEEEKIFG